MQPFFLTCQVRVVTFYQNVLPLPASFFLLLLAKHHLPPHECNESRRTSSVASLDCMCQFVIAAHLVGLLQRDQNMWASPDLYWSRIAVGFAGLYRLENLSGPRPIFTARQSPWASSDFYGAKTRFFAPGRRPNSRISAYNVRWNAR